MQLKEIRDLLEGRLEGDPEIEIHSVNGIEEARKGEITFLSHKKYVAALTRSQCAAVIAPHGLSLETDKAVLRVENPYLAFARLLEVFHPPRKEPPGISGQSFVSETARLGEGVTVYPLAFIGKGAEIGAHSILYPGVFVGENVSLGANVTLHANVSVCAGTVIGDRVMIHSGAVIGSDGFGYVPDAQGRRHKIPQVGRVVIEEDVEIGANTCIDRGTIGDTRIRRGVKLDNMVQIAHNCVVEQDTVMAAQVGISGSCTIGKRVMLGGQVGVADHVSIGDDVMIIAQSGVPSDLEEKKIYAGSPTVDRNTWRKTQIALPRVPELIKKIRALEKRIEQLEEK